MPVSGIDVLPRTNGPNLVESYVTQMLTADSIMPSSLSERYFSFLCTACVLSVLCSCSIIASSSIKTDFLCSLKKEFLTCSLIDLFFITIKFQGWENPTDGA